MFFTLVFGWLLTSMSGNCGALNCCFLEDLRTRFTTSAFSIFSFSSEFPMIFFSKDDFGNTLPAFFITDETIFLTPFLMRLLVFCALFLVAAFPFFADLAVPVFFFTT